MMDWLHSWGGNVRSTYSSVGNDLGQMEQAWVAVLRACPIPQLWRPLWVPVPGGLHHPQAGVCKHDRSGATGKYQFHLNISLIKQ